MFRRNRTVLSTAVIALAAVTALSGCGRSSATTGKSKAATISSGKATGTVTMWAQGTEGADLPSVLKGFEAANPGVTVKVSPIPWPSAHSKYQTAIAGGTTPDIAQMGTTWMADFANAFAPVPSQVDTSGMYSSATAAATVDGTAVGVPWYVDTRVIYYRKDLAAQAGYSTPPTTWDGLQAMAKAMQDKAGAQWGIELPTGVAGGFESNFMPFAWSAGASLMNADQTKWTLDTPQMTKAMSYLQSFFTKGIADKNPDTDPGAVEASFVAGKTAMFIDAPASIGTLNQAGGPGFADKYGVMRIPASTSSTSFVGGSDLVVFKKAKNSDAAWKLVQWLSKPANQTAFFKATGDLPATKSAWKDPSLSGDQNLAVFGAQLVDTKAPPANTGWTQVAAAGDQQIERVVKSGTDPASAMAALQKSADGIGTKG